jgi:pyrroloquinoline-quinone synthase
MDKLIQSILTETAYAQNPYFTALKSGVFTKEDFVETQIQFYFAVLFFSRPMAALAAKIPTPEQRLEVLRNAWEEHGEGMLDKTHGRTFLELLQRLNNITPDMVEDRKLWPEVRIFNTTLVGAAVLDDYLIGVGMLGMIERMFCEISSWIGRDIIARGWMTTENMIHYNAHEKVDIRHSQDFFDILEPVWKRNDPSERYCIEQGLRLGATVFNDLYLGLYRSRAKRLTGAPTHSTHRHAP